MSISERTSIILGFTLFLACGLQAGGCSPSGGEAPAPGSGGPAVAAAPGSAAGGAQQVAAAAAPASSGATAVAGTPAAASAEQAKAEIEKKAKKSIDMGLKWLRSQQAEDGSYGNHPGVTAMVLQAFLLSHRKYREDDGPFVRRAVEYVVSMAKPNGAIFDKNLPTYNTALSLLALGATRNPAYKELIKKGQQFLIGIQAAEQNDYREEDKFYGGIGYGSSERPDMPNLQFAIQALVETGYDGDKAVYRKALRFLERCQNRSESNDQPWAGNDGGFVYTTGDSKAGGTQSYGSMTYAGLMSLMYVDVDKKDPRVQDAYKWVQNNWDLETHPGMGDTGLYFYYHTLGKALSVYGEPIIVDAQGRSHDWAAELIETVVARQSPEGWWVNKNPEYWEGNKLLTTARALLALESALGLTVLRPAAAPPAPAAASPGAGSAAPAPVAVPASGTAVPAAAPGN